MVEDKSSTEKIPSLGPGKGVTSAESAKTRMVNRVSENAASPITPLPVPENVNVMGSALIGANEAARQNNGVAMCLNQKGRIPALDEFRILGEQRMRWSWMAGFISLSHLLWIVHWECD
jgi:hypothetical protein